MSRNKGLRKLEKALHNRNKAELRKIRKTYQHDLDLLDKRVEDFGMDKYVEIMHRFCSKTLRKIDLVLADE